MKRYVCKSRTVLFVPWQTEGVPVEVNSTWEVKNEWSIGDERSLFMHNVETGEHILLPTRKLFWFFDRDEITLTNAEKVINGLTACLDDHRCFECPYNKIKNCDRLKTDALKVIMEQMAEITSLRSRSDEA